MANVALSAGIRDTLLTIQRTAAAAQETESRLATGKKVNSAVDNPLAYFSALNLTDRASDLSSLQDSMQQAVRTVNAASTGIDGMTKLLQTAQGIASSAAATTDTTTRASLQTQYNALLAQADELMKNSGYGGINLLNGDTLTVSFDRQATTATLSVNANGGTALTASALGVTTNAVNGWNNNAATAGDTTGNAAIQTQLTNLTKALGKLRAEASGLGANQAIITARQDFTKSIIATLRSGADDWTLADLNEEGAKLTALNTRSQLAQTALSLSSQRDQAVLRLFG
ncbi:flagellin N-terminal helical domain-containing protein [Alsobacter sp. SYSU BS001988]